MPRQGALASLLETAGRLYNVAGVWVRLIIVGAVDHNRGPRGVSEPAGLEVACLCVLGELRFRGPRGVVES